LARPPPPGKKYFSPSFCAGDPLFVCSTGEFIFLLIVDYVFGIFSISAPLARPRLNLFLWLLSHPGKRLNSFVLMHVVPPSWRGERHLLWVLSRHADCISA
jgi:hypothetical protein